MKLLGVHPSPFTRKVRIVLAEKKIKCDFVIASPQADPAAVAAYNPLGKVPVLVLDDGTALYDSPVIVEFLDGVSPNGRLIPQDNRERIEVRRWEALADGVVEAAILIRYEGLRSDAERSAAWIERQMTKVNQGLDAMETQLGGRPSCAGSAFSLADIAVGVCLDYLDFRFPDLGWKPSHPGLARLQGRLAERESFSESAPRD